MFSFVIDGRLTGCNEHTKQSRTSYHIANATKVREMQRVIDAIDRSIIPTDIGRYLDYPVRILFEWFEPNGRRDLDNVRYGAKFILDGMVKAGVITDDSQKYIEALSDKFGVDKEHPRIIVTIYEQYER